MEESLLKSTPGWLWAVGIAVIILFVYVIWYFIDWSNSSVRLNRILKNLDIYKTIVSIAPVECTDPSSNPYKVCDYYIAGASRPIFAANSIFDYTSEQAIQKILVAGARWIELDIMEEGGKPIVSVENTRYNFRQTLNKVYLEDALNIIAQSAWNPSVVSNSSDPLFLSLNIAGNNTTLINNTAALINQYLGSKLLDTTYSYQRKNIAQEPICNLINKVVIVSGGNSKNTDLDEFVNISWAGSNLRRNGLTATEETYDHNELTDYNKQNLTVVYQDPSTSNKNKSAEVCATYGCQVVMMNYASPDEAMEEYLERFQLSSFVLKPASLRYSTPTYPEPTPQNPVKSYQPISVNTSLYQITI